jgi:hypothetical protein
MRPPRDDTPHRALRRAGDRARALARQAFARHPHLARSRPAQSPHRMGALLGPTRPPRPMPRMRG